ncbi:MAG: chloride channel protein [Pseudomonadota bacterium]|nr:chloride channel protein [Pseudomonadota bacterium]
MKFWGVVVLTGAGAGIGAALLTSLLTTVQHLAWPGPDLLDAAEQRKAWAHVAILLGAGFLTGAGQLILRHLTSGNGIDISEAIAEFGGRMPPFRAVGSALLSIVVVGMGASLGREGAPKQIGAVLANVLSDGARLSDEQRRLLVACGAGAGMAAAYGVPLGGTLFALEVLRGVLALRLILPALLASAIAAGVSWLWLPNAPTYVIPAYPASASVVCWAVVAGPIAGLVSIGYVHFVAWADRHKPTGRLRLIAPMITLGALGFVSIPFPQVLGNGKDVAQLAFNNQFSATLLISLLILRPLSSVLCLGTGVPGGLFTPSIALGALLGGVLGLAWEALWPGVPPGLFAVLGAAAVLAATTHGPISAVVLMMELTGRDRSFVLPLLLIVVTATVVARTLDARSIYDARFSTRQIASLQNQRRPSAT